jgi:hypothetical protein
MKDKILSIGYVLWLTEILWFVIIRLILIVFYDHWIFFNNFMLAFQ